MDIEGFAVGALLQRLAYIENLQSFVSLRDKEPLWDGHIYVYKDESKNKEDINRIPIQVKGRVQAKRRRNTKLISYPVETIALEGYLKDGGVLYFVVDVPESSKKGKSIDIYYCTLLPYDLRKALKIADEQKTVSISLNLLPESRGAIRRLISKAVEDRQKQAGYNNIPEDKLEEYKNIGQFPLTFEFDLGKNSTNFLKDINEQQPYIYAKRPDGTLIPIDKGGKFTSWTTKYHSNVSVNGELFYNEYKEIREDSGAIKMCLGCGNNFILDPQKDELQSRRNGHFRCDYVGTLDQQIHDTDFFCRTIENNGFEINGKKYEIFLNPDESAVLDTMQKKLEDFSNFRKALNIAGYPNDLPVTDFDEKTWRLVDDFKAVILEGKEKKFTNLPTGTYFCKITFGQTTLALLVCKSDTVCSIYNPYTHVFPLYCEDKSGQKNSLSPFVLFDTSLLSSVTYLDFDAIWKSLQDIPLSDNYRSYINNLMLRMLVSHDNSAPLKKELLDFSLTIAQWLYDTVENNNLHEKQICLLNLMQINRRKEALSSNEINQLYGLLGEDQQMCDMNKTGVYILVENFDKARECYDKLTSDDQKVFWEFPIMTLWNADNKPCKKNESSEVLSDKSGDQS